MRQFFGWQLFGCCLLVVASCCSSGCGAKDASRQGAIPVEQSGEELKQVMDENLSQGGGEK